MRASTTCATSIVTIPRDKFTVITGVSGSGKSTVAFDILFAEGQRRYLESLNAYARQFVEPAGRADVDAVYGIPPTVAIEQRTSRGGRKSTVATLTEIYHFLRLFYVKLGVQHCPDCDIAIDAQSAEAIHAKLLTRYRGKRIALLAPLVIGRKGYYTELADWAAARGYRTLRVDGVATPTDRWPRLDRFKEHDIELPIAEIDVAAAAGRRACERARPGFALGPQHGARAAHRQAQRQRHGEPASCSRPSARADAAAAASSRSIRGSFRTTRATAGVRAATAPASSCQASTTSRPARRRGGRKPRPIREVCEQCEGQRLRPEAMAVRFRDRSIGELTAQSVRQSLAYFRAVEAQGPRARDRARRVAGARRPFELSRPRRPFAISRSIAPRRRFPAAKRSGFASRRSSAPICAASATSSMSRRSVCIRETTSCCSARSTQLAQKGNTIVVVEHDEATIRRAEHVVDLGPGAGRNGGEVVVNGSLDDLLAARESITGRVLATPPQHPLQPRRTVAKRGGTPWLTVRGADAPQPAQPELRVAARTVRLRHRRERQRQEHARARCAARQPGAGSSRAAAVGARRSLRAASASTAGNV